VAAQTVGPPTQLSGAPRPVSPDSRQILQRFGFVELATTTPFTRPGDTVDNPILDRLSRDGCAADGL
jgi:hypothetical protein